jgi:hypothetical protein
VAEVVDVFKNGPKHHPDANCTTRRNEAALGIASSVYAYLGKTVPDFGDAAFALPLGAVTGQISPFDTGGLVKHIAPVAGWDDDARRAYLAAFTWPTSDRDTRLAAYPGSDLNGYLNGNRPLHAGPHGAWPNAQVAAIWNEPSNSWRAWTWEARSKGRMPKPSSLRAWSCSPAMHQEIQEYAAKSTKKAEVAFVAKLLTTYVRGGVSRLVADLRAEQAA